LLINNPINVEIFNRYFMRMNFFPFLGSELTLCIAVLWVPALFLLDINHPTEGGADLTELTTQVSKYIGHSTS
jgi:hypothetical protein